MTDRPSPAQDVETGRFVAGNSGNGGRPKGSRNKLGEAYLADLYAAWKDHGPEVIKRVIEEKPSDMLKVIASILPKEVVVRPPEEDLTDEQMDAALDIIGRLVERRGLAGAASPTHKGQGTA